MSETVSERPTFSQAFASDTPVADSLTADPSTVTSSAADPTPAAASEQPVAEAKAEVTPAEGPVPYARFKEINEAKKSLDEKLNALKWAESVDRRAVEQAQQLGQLYQQDRAGYIRQLMAEALADQQLAPLVRSEAARVLGTRGQAPQAPDFSPDIPVLDSNGQVVSHAFSAERVQQYVQHTVQQALADFAGKELSPIKQDFQTRQQRERAEQERQQLEAEVQDIWQESIDVFPLLEEHKEEIGKVFETIPGDARKALQKAWHQVIGHKLALADQVKAQQLETLKTKAAASTVNPTAAVVSTTHRPRSLTDPSLKW